MVLSWAYFSEISLLQGDLAFPWTLLEIREQSYLGLVQFRHSKGNTGKEPLRWEQ